MMMAVTMCWQTPHPTWYVLAGMHIHASCRAPAPAGRCRPLYDATLYAHAPAPVPRRALRLAEAAMPAHTLAIGCRAAACYLIGALSTGVMLTRP